MGGAPYTARPARPSRPSQPDQISRQLSWPVRLGRPTTNIAPRTLPHHHRFPDQHSGNTLPGPGASLSRGSIGFQGLSVNGLIIKSPGDDQSMPEMTRNTPEIVLGLFWTYSDQFLKKYWRKCQKNGEKTTKNGRKIEKIGW